jgi:hypothetical protein
MRREHRILLAALAGLVLLVLGARIVNEEVSRGDAVSTASNLANMEANTEPTSTSVASVATTSNVNVIAEVPAPRTVASPIAPLDSLASGSLTPTESTPDTDGCAASGHSAVVDRAKQRAWLCDNGEVTHTFVMTSARSQPDPGSYKVYAKDLNSSSMLTGKFSTMTHFVAFTIGEHTGARIAFHSIPKYADGSYVQPLDSVGTARMRGASSGCIRVLYEDSVRIWDWLSNGDPVIVIS